MSVISIRQTEVYQTWIERLRDRQAVARIDVRIRRLSLGNPGQVREVGHGVSEMKVDYGPGYRVYYINRGTEIIVLLCGGDKKSQRLDIANAVRLAKEL